MGKKVAVCNNCNKNTYIKAKGLCNYCYNGKLIEMMKSKGTTKKTVAKKPIKQKRPGYKRSTYCSEATLDSLVSKLTRTLFQDKCYGVCKSSRVFKFSEVECAHFCVRKHKSTRFLLGNVMPACPSCNRFTPEHVYMLGINIDKIYGEGTAQEMLILSKKNCKISPKTRKEMYNYLKGVLEETNHIIEQSLITKENYRSKLQELAVNTHKEQIEKFIKPNLI